MGDDIVRGAQSVGLILAALGLSAGPWIIALLWGRLLTRRAHEDRVADLLLQAKRADERADKAEARADVEHERAETERQRADRATDALTKVAGEMGRTTVHLLKSLPASDGGEVGG